MQQTSKPLILVHLIITFLKVFKTFLLEMLITAKTKNSKFKLVLRKKVAFSFSLIKNDFVKAIYYQ